MGKLTETYVQEKALGYLKKHYEEKFHPTTVYALKEAIIRIKG
jgi:hypothetical protein